MKIGITVKDVTVYPVNMSYLKRDNHVLMDVCTVSGKDNHGIQ